MDENSEIYIYLGKNENNHYFLHKIHYPNHFNLEISQQIYNVLIAHKYIFDENENVFIMEITENFEYYLMTTVQHEEKKEIITYTKENFKNLDIYEMFNLQKEKTLVIKYVYEVGAFFWYELDIDLMAIVWLGEEKLKCYSVSNNITKKKILT